MNLEDTKLKTQRDVPQSGIKLGATALDISEAIEIHKAKYEGMTEKERARHYWETWLKNEVRIQVPQNLNCEFAIVIPAMNEKPERILKQIESIKNQKGIDPSQFEVIYVIGNDLPTNDPKSKETFALNQRVIETLRGVSGLNVFVIDKSSPGHEIVNTNIGKARNRGVAEASLRFYENGKNGILIQTDSDSYFEDENYLSKLRTMSHENPDVIGIAGGIVFEFSPDTTNEVEIAELRKKLEMFVLIQKWDLLVQFLRDPDYSYHIDTKAFSGANMISRSYESAVIGGLIDYNGGEDPQFRKDLESYGAGRGQKIIAAKNELVVITALRESDRTTASFKKEFDRIDIDKPFMVSDPFTEETLPEFRDKLKTVLEQSVLDQSDLRNLLTDDRGFLIVSENSLADLVEHVGQNGVKEDDTFFRTWITKNFGANFNLTQKLYDVQHPQILLTEENYQKLLDRVKQHPKGLEFIKNSNAYFGNIRML